ncbi:ABC transporter ATP-binding protein/permease [bacterium]|nr:ABC transporter ATP-binding protein/permease [bacterium]
MCVLGLLVSSVFGLLVPWMTREAVDAVSAAAGGGGPAGESRLLRAVGLMILFSILYAAFRFVSRRALFVAARDVEREVRRRLFSHVVRLPLRFFHETPTGDVMSRTTNDLSAVWVFLGPGLLMLVGTVITWVLALAFMLRISPVLTGVSLLIAPAVVYLSREYGRAFHRRHRLVQESLASMNGALQENVSGIRLVKAFTLEAREEERFSGECERYYRHNLAVARTSAAFHGAIGLLAGTGVALVLFLGGRAVARGDLTLGGFVAFNAYLAMLSFPTMAMGWVINLFQRGSSAMGRINEFLRQPVEFPEGEGEPAAGGTAPAGDARMPGAGEPPLLEVRGLVFSHGGDGRGEVLRGISLAARKGEVLGIVGPTGGGKSTLLSLLSGLHPAPPGSVFLEGIDASTIPLPDLRRRFAVVSQDPFLFSDTVLENVCFGLERTDPEAARKASGLARILAEVEEMPSGFDTVVGERGVTLSGGQKQRVTIARALCAGAPILLLDDALSAVDAGTEREIFEGILSGRGERTVLFSTHRMASLSRCDRIFVLSGGRIVEEGTHDDLLSLRGAYFDLYSRQMLARELEESS